MWYHFKKYNFPLRSKELKQKITYKGDDYTIDRDGFLRKTTGNRNYLHLRIWREHFGEIPPFAVVYFKNSDKLDVRPENLALKPAKQVIKERGFVNNQWTKRWPDKYDFSAIKCNHCEKVFEKGAKHFRKRKFCDLKCYNEHRKKTGKKKFEVIKVRDEH